MHTFISKGSLEPKATDQTLRPKALYTNSPTLVESLASLMPEINKTELKFICLAFTPAHTGVNEPSKNYTISSTIFLELQRSKRHHVVVDEVVVVNAIEDVVVVAVAIVDVVEL